ncbi:NADP(H)-dependent aldo-keto reductase [Methylobacillus caricis]|uniref:NADP(H)-dependent aldo-keto reductase n=1 Tax=Methylobacillus caricis TaxID=1971611 RepID=UPI001CFFE20D|nr:NADP(H)-dependent aldo-keto reductase [Methylobacillus caricis]MCB5186510.1 NADP(H)-dependent aldo-keto reductase [Methylobacillus caricis]
MEYRKLGKSDLNVSAICLGTMTYGDQNTEAEGHEQMDYALAQGINFIDTAEMYPVPPKAETVTRTETIIGSWLKKQARDKVILASKVAGGNRKMEWIRSGPKAVDRANVRAAIEGSLKRLQTDYLDLYQIHWPERNVPIFGQYQFDPGKEKEWVSIHNQLETLAELVKEGKVRYIGVSNEQPWGVMEFIRLSNQYNLPRIASIQNSYSLLNRGFEFGMTEIVYREQVSLTAYSPLAFGHLTGKYIDNPQAQGRVNLFPGYAQRYTKPNVAPASAAYAELARKHGLTPTELALGFVYSRWFVTSTIIGATSMSQLQENIAAWQKPLNEEILQEIEAIHLRYMNPAP